MSQYEAKVQNKFDCLLHGLNSKLSGCLTKDDVAVNVAGLVAAALFAHLDIDPQDTNIHSAFIKKNGLPQNIAEEMFRQIKPVIAFTKKDWPTSYKEYPEVPDMAAPLLDVKMPKTERKKIGFFCTTPPIIKQMLKELDLSGYKGTPKLVDHSAGSGSLVLNALEDYSRQWPTDENKLGTLVKEICNNWLIVERDKHMAAIISIQLLLFFLRRNIPMSAIERWPVECKDAFEDHSQRRFTHAIGNPPYIGEKQARASIQQALTLYPELKNAYTGKADLSFLFLLHGILSLKNNGKLVYLTPAYWPTADGASFLRDAITKEAHVKGLTKPADDIYSAKGVEVVVVSLIKSDVQNKNDTLWRFNENSKQTLLLDAIEKSSVELCSERGSMIIKSGIQSGADKVSRAHLKLLDKTAKEGSGIYLLSENEYLELFDKLSVLERSIIHPYIKSPACGPFVYDDTPGGYMIYLDGSKDIEQLPQIKKHLLPYRKILEKRRECLQGKIKWWQLHWPRQKEIFTSESILVPQRASFPRFGYAPNGAFTSVDVYHLLPVNESVDMLAQLALFHSSVVKLWLKLRGKRKGKLYELYRTPLSKVPVPLKINNRKRLGDISKNVIKILDEIKSVADSNKALYLILEEMKKQNAPAAMAYKREIQLLDEFIFGEYNLSEEDRLQIKRAE